MRVSVEWSKPVPMKSLPSMGYTVDLDRLPMAPGIYVFGRLMGDHFEALYVGKATRLRGRVKTQLNNLKLMTHVRQARIGKRVLMIGNLATKGLSGTQIDTHLALIERTLIRYFLTEGHDLVNVHGTRIRQHEIHSQRVPKRFIPGRMYVDRG